MPGWTVRDVPAEAGELLCGHAPACQPGRKGFFRIPDDAGGDALRLFVLGAATVEVEVGAGAELLAGRELARG